MAGGISYASWLAGDDNVWGRLHISYICLAGYVFTHLTSGLQLISLSDLENDFVNPHDASAAINRWVVSTSL